MRWYRKKTIKYEVMCLMSHESCVDEKLERLQNEGWELAGEILIKNSDGRCTHNFLHIPLKRKLK